MLKNIVKRGVQSALGLALVFEVALLNMPDQISSSLEDYMAENNIPTSLVENVQTDDIRVYHEPDGLSSMHLAAFLFWNNAKEGDPIHAMVDPIRVGLSPDRYPEIWPAQGECMIRMPKSPFDAEEFVAEHAGVQIHDLELSEEVKQNLLSFILMHEVGHAQRSQDGMKEFCENRNTRNESINAVQNIIPLQEELRGELFALEKFDAPEIMDFSVAFRSVTGFLSDNVSHDIAIYMPSHEMDNNADALPDISKHFEMKQEFVQLFMPFLNDQPLEENLTYRAYKAALDLLEDNAAMDELSPAMIQMTEQYIKGLEYLAPMKAGELRLERGSTYEPSTIELSV